MIKANTIILPMYKDSFMYLSEMAQLFSILKNEKK